MLFVLATSILIASAEPQSAAPPEKDAWIGCLTDYAQAESAGTKTPVTITIEALAACRPERAAYWQSLVKRGVDRQVAGDTIAGEEREAARTLITFIAHAR